jgi:hypothetical protein
MPVVKSRILAALAPSDIIRRKRTDTFTITEAERHTYMLVFKEMFLDKS